jgi:hypothetical protein
MWSKNKPSILKRITYLSIIVCRSDWLFPPCMAVCYLTKSSLNFFHAGKFFFVAMSAFYISNRLLWWIVSCMQHVGCDLQPAYMFVQLCVFYLAFTCSWIHRNFNTHIAFFCELFVFKSKSYRGDWIWLYEMDFSMALCIGLRFLEF